MGVIKKKEKRIACLTQKHRHNKKLLESRPFEVKGKACLLVQAYMHVPVIAFVTIGLNCTVSLPKQTVCQNNFLL